MHCTNVLNSARANAHDRAKAYSNRAIAEVFKSGLDPSGKAAADSSSALRLDPNVGAAHLAHGLIYMDQRRHRESISEFDAAIADNMETWLQAEAYYGRAIEHMHLAVYSHDKSLVRLGMDDVGEAIRLSPSAVFYNWRATMEEAFGDKDAAQRDRDQANRLQGGGQ
jgi:tetratricopeptide (TPR) repeat protein